VDEDPYPRHEGIQANKRKANKNLFVFFQKCFRSGGDENKRRMENNVNARR
jgi:hypothetical protein